MIGVQEAAAVARPGAGASGHDWRRHLPDAWEAVVEPPLDLSCFREYEMDAERWVGCDAGDQPCYTAHRYVIATPGAAAYAEEMAAWRLRDERWLIFRVAGAGNGIPPRGVYTIGPEMPR